MLQAERDQPEGAGRQRNGARGCRCRTWMKKHFAAEKPPEPPLLPPCCSTVQDPRSVETYDGFQTCNRAQNPLAKASHQSRAGGAVRPWPTRGHILHRKGDPDLR